MPTCAAPRLGRWLLAVLLVAAGVVAGWLVVYAVLALPLPEGVLFGLSALGAAAFLAGAVFSRRFLLRAGLLGGFVGVACSIALVLLLVK